MLWYRLDIKIDDIGHMELVMKVYILKICSFCFVYFLTSDKLCCMFNFAVVNSLLDARYSSSFIDFILGLNLTHQMWSSFHHLTSVQNYRGNLCGKWIDFPVNAMMYQILMDNLIKKADYFFFLLGLCCFITIWSGLLLVMKNLWQQNLQ